MSESERKTFEFMELMKNNKSRSGTIRPCPEDVILIEDSDYIIQDDLEVIGCKSR